MLSAVLAVLMLACPSHAAGDPAAGEGETGTVDAVPEPRWWRAQLEPAVFGGVTFGKSFYPYLIQPSKKYYDGRQGQLFADAETFTVSSSFLAQISDTRFYTGFGVSAAFGSRASATEGYNNPYCPPGAESEWEEVVDGEYFSCENIMGTQSRSETLLHVPAEWQFAYAYRPVKWFMFNLGGALSITYYNYEYRMEQTGVGLDTYADANGDLIDDYYYYWDESFRQTVPLKAQSVLPGVAVFAAADFIFGKLPRIGGEWGLTLNAKYTRVKWDYRNIQQSYKVQAEDWGSGTVWGDLQGRKSESQFVDLSNGSLGLGLSYHY